MGTIILTVVSVVVGLLAFIALLLSFYTVEQQTVGVVQRWGKYLKITQAGLHFKIPFVDTVTTVDLRIQQLNVRVETKTKDNVFVGVQVSVQYFVLPDKVYDAAYKLENPEHQMQSYVFDVVRAKVPEIDLDDVFLRKDDIANAVEAHLKEVMDDFGYGLKKTLVTDIDPDANVKSAMNERAAADKTAEAKKILMVKAAEAEAESKALQGEGIAKQRRAIVEGLKDSVEAFQAAVKGTDPHDVMSLVSLTQYFDMLEKVGANGKSAVILIPHSPGAVHDLMGQLRQSIISADQVGEAAATVGADNK